MTTYYAGIGSRSTPPRVQERMTSLAKDYAAMGWVLRSGAAEGADAAFERGAGDLKEIWLPWRGFNGHPSLLTPKPGAFVMAASFHPAWDRLSQGAQKLHARNCHQIFGPDLETPVELVLFWTPSGGIEGGTGQALRIAKHYGIRALCV